MRYTSIFLMAHSNFGMIGVGVPADSAVSELASPFKPGDMAHQAQLSRGHFFHTQWFTN